MLLIFSDNIYSAMFAGLHIPMFTMCAQGREAQLDLVTRPRTLLRHYFVPSQGQVLLLLITWEVSVECDCCSNAGICSVFLLASSYFKYPRRVSILSVNELFWTVELTQYCCEEQR